MLCLRPRDVNFISREARSGFAFCLVFCIERLSLARCDLKKNENRDRALNFYHQSRSNQKFLDFSFFSPLLDIIHLIHLVFYTDQG